MKTPTLKTVIGTQGNTAALKDGTVRPGGFAFDFEEVQPLVSAFRRMVRGLQYDVCEMAITTYLAAREHGKRAKRIYMDRLSGGKIENPTAVDELHRRVMAIAGDPLPYGVEPNRPVLTEMIDAALDQGIIDSRPSLESLFARGTGQLVA